MKVIKKIIPVCMAIMMTVSLSACSNNSTENPQSTKNEVKQENRFPEFVGTDFDGNKVDHTLFNKNEVTLLNFWFNGCSACVNEMPALEELNEKLHEKGAELLGINVETRESDKVLSEAKEILAKQGVTYKNLFIDGEQEALDYIKNIFAFPTTIMVDKNGNIIGDPITGSIEDEDKMDEILKMVDDVKNGKEIVSSTSSEETENEEMVALQKEQDDIFLEHKEMWDKVFANIQKSDVEQLDDSTYAEFLKAQIDHCKTLFTEDELKILDEDIKKIDELDKKMQALIDKQ